MAAAAAPFPVPYLPKYKYAQELIATANQIATPGKGILAADESTGTIGARFKGIGVENNQKNRRDYRELLFTAPGLNKHISGVITFEETLFDKAEDGTPLIKFLQDQGIAIGIKVDLGTRPLPGTDGETYTQGLTDLDKRCAKYYEAGARFAKWRAVVKISRNTPSPNAIQETAHTLARYAAICQEHGLAPIVEPEILMDGDHSIEVCQYWTEKVVAACYKALSDQEVLLEGTMLKPNMVLPGKQFGKKASPEEVALATITALKRTVPPAVPSINFLSGGQSEEEASQNLNAMNAMGFKLPWAVSFSFGRGLQASCLEVWRGEKKNAKAAQEALLAVAKNNGLATLGQYKGGAGSGKDLYQKNYKY